MGKDNEKINTVAIYTHNYSKIFSPAFIKYTIKITFINIIQTLKLIWQKGEKLVEIEGIISKFNINNKKDLYRLHKDFEGDYAKEIILAYKKLGKGGKTINVGSAQGFYVIFSALAGNNVIAFEPDPEIFNILKKNVDLNKVETKVICINYALGDKIGKGILFTSGASGPAPNFNSQDGFKKKIEVPIFRMDNVINDSPDILVIDVEGYEEKVLKGMGDLRPKDIFIEIHPDRLSKLGTSEEVVRKILTDYGYKLRNQYRRRKEFHSHFSI